MIQRDILRHGGVWAAVIVIALAALAFGAQAQGNFSPPKNISNTLGNSMSQQIAVDSHGNIDVVWTDNTPGNYVLFFSRSTDGGSTFSAPLNISNNANGTVETPRLATDQAGNIYVGWEDWVSSTSSLALFSRSVNGGATFSAPAAISSGTASSAPRIAVDLTGAIDFTWSDNSAGYASVFFRRSTDQGNTFSTPVNVSNNPSGAGGPYLSLDPSGNIYIAWVGNATFNGQLTSFVYFSGAPEGSNAFSTPTQVSVFEGPFAQLGSAEVAATSASNIVVVWTFTQSNGSGTLLGASSNNGGSTFTSNLSTSSGEYPPFQEVAIDPGGGVDLVWQVSGGNDSANVNFGRTLGGSFTVTSVATVDGNTPNPQIAVDSQGKIDVVFYGLPGSSGSAGIQYMQSTNSGATFSAVQSISADSGQLPQIALNSSGNSYVVWQAGDNAEDVFFTSNASAASAPGGVSSFSVTASPTALVVTVPGQSASTTLTLASKGGFAGAGVLASSSCGAASLGITCSLTAFTLPANGTVTATLTFSTTAALAANASVRYIVLALLLSLGLLYSFATRRRERRWSFAFAAVLFAILITGVGCGSATTGAMNGASGSSGSAGDPPGNSGTPVGAVSSVSVPIVINGTTQTVPGLTLTVQ